jgi:CO/xanthine dehydrogenase Mo-binding subunit
VIIGECYGRGNKAVGKGLTVEKTISGLKVIMALDHGQVINPDGLLAQAQGSAVFALGMMFNNNVRVLEC